MKKKILILFGTRPEAIKMAPIVKELQKNIHFETKICVTAQHREMLDQVLNFFQIKPDYDLDLMKPNQSLNQLSASILNKIDQVLVNFSPDFVLVHGDTTTSCIGALASYHRGIKIGHVEAGLRTYNKFSPFPEEINRQLTGRIADIHFAPTQKAYNNLVKFENIDPKNVFITGNTVIDSLIWGLENINTEREEIKNLIKFINPQKKLILITGHRRENFGTRLESICESYTEIAKRDDVQLIYPVHLNPNVQKVVYDKMSNNNNILLIEPLDYEVFIWLMSQSYIIITDSGGVQEEAPTLKKPVLVTRNVTEREEAVEIGAVKLVGTDKLKIVSLCNQLLDDEKFYSNMISKVNPYGDGLASKRIVNTLIEVIK